MTPQEPVKPPLDGKPEIVKAEIVKPRLAAAFAAASTGGKAAMIGGVLAALLLFSAGLSWMMSPTMTSTGGQVFAEKPPAAAAPEKPWLERMMTLSPFGGGSSGSETAAASSADASSGWHFRHAVQADARAAAPSGERGSAAAPRLQAGSLPGLGGISGGSSGASASYASRSDGVFHGDGGTGLVVKDLKHAAAQTGWRPGPKASAEDVRGFGAKQADVLQTTRGDRFAMTDGSAMTGSGAALGGPGAPEAHSAAAPNDTKNDSFKDPANKPQESKQQPSMSPPGAGGGSPGKNCQALEAPNAPTPAGAAPTDPTRTQNAESLCQANTNIAQHKELANGDSDNADAKQCAAVCNKGAAAAAAGPGAAGPSGRSNSSSSRDGYKTLQKKADEEMKKLADKAKNQCLDPNQQAEKAVQGLDSSAATGPLGDAASFGDGQVAAAQQGALQGQASTAAQGWQPKVADARQTHQRASQACQQLAQSSTFQPVEDKLKTVADKLRQDYQTLQKARVNASVPDGDLMVGPDTRRLLSQSQREYQKARQAYDKSSRALEDFKSSTQQGAIKTYNERVGQYVEKADQAVGRSNQAIGTAQPGSGESFMSAQGSVRSAMSPLQAGAGGDYNAGAAVLQRVQALPTQ